MSKKGHFSVYWPVYLIVAALLVAWVCNSTQPRKATTTWQAPAATRTSVSLTPTPVFPGGTTYKGVHLSHEEVRYCYGPSTTECLEVVYNAHVAGPTPPPRRLTDSEADAIADKAWEDHINELAEQAEREHLEWEAWKADEAEIIRDLQWQAWLDQQYEEEKAAGQAQQAPCDCGGNLYNCADFSSQAAAQQCYQYCGELTGYDVHWLDGDSDGVACE